MFTVIYHASCFVFVVACGCKIVPAVCIYFIPLLRQLLSTCDHWRRSGMVSAIGLGLVFARVGVSIFWARHYHSATAHGVRACGALLATVARDSDCRLFSSAVVGCPAKAVGVLFAKLVMCVSCRVRLCPRSPAAAVANCGCHVQLRRSECVFVSDAVIVLSCRVCLPLLSAAVCGCRVQLRSFFNGGFCFQLRQLTAAAAA